MGHIHLGRLPATKNWRAVTALIADGSAVDAIAGASAAAAERDLLRAPKDPVFVEAVRLLALIPQAARQKDFTAALRAIGIDAPTQPGLMDLVLATTSALDRIAGRSGQRSDFGELSARALADTLASTIGPRLPGLFEPNGADVRAAAARLGTSDAFSDLSRQFFGRLVSETLQSWISRTLSSHVGADRRFQGANDRSAFDAALRQYTSEATQIIQVFAGGWYGKTLFREGTISSERAAAFGYVAFKKITEELARKAPQDA